MTGLPIKVDKVIVLFCQAKPDHQIGLQLSSKKCLFTANINVALVLTDYSLTMCTTAREYSVALTTHLSLKV